jgi:hypothetical protein
MALSYGRLAFRVYAGGIPVCGTFGAVANPLSGEVSRYHDEDLRIVDYGKQSFYGCIAGVGVGILWPAVLPFAVVGWGVNRYRHPEPTKTE